MQMGGANCVHVFHVWSLLPKSVVLSDSAITKSINAMGNAVLEANPLRETECMKGATNKQPREMPA